jgi:hypothetical protein
MTEDKKYQFNILTEESSAEDLFEDKTHRKIAETLCGIIQDGNSEGITIGLEGGWGSGKSTVVSILKNILAKDTIYFYFDAWAHEGDPLRRIFLEALIDQIINGDNKNVLDKTELELLEKKKKVISKREKISHSVTTQTATMLGKLLALATLCVPFGVALLSGAISKYGLQWKGEINWIFLIGLIFAVAPILVVFHNILKIVCKQKSIKGIFNSDSWLFLQGESENISTQEVSENEERSSIEFERYFIEILEIIFSKQGNERLLIVVDNLDRIDASDSLKIWSTLQTFLQRRNPINKGSSYLKKIWVLVPYDEEGLEKLWKDNSSEQKYGGTNSDTSTKILGTANRNCAKSFFDKCFQLRIAVPKLILTGWESFCKTNIDLALNSWKENEKNAVLDVLKWTRETVNDIPTPREIKTYVNQVGLLRLHCNEYISSEAIAYFAVQKYIMFQKNSDIERQLVEGTLPPDKLKPNFKEGLTSELSGILFGVSAEKGHQLLLEPEIGLSLENKESDRIKELADIHKKAFWTVLNLYSARSRNPIVMMQYSYSIWNGLWKSSPDECVAFIRYLKAASDKFESLEFPTKENVDEYVAMFSLLDAGKYNFSVIWRFIIKALNEKMRQANFDYQVGVKILSDLAACQTRKKTLIDNLGLIPIENWIKWATASSEGKISTYFLVKPTDGFINEIASKIVAGSPIPDRLYDLVEYLINGGEETWEPVINAIRGHIEWNQGIQDRNIFSIEIFRILTRLSAKGEDVLKYILPIVKNGCFYNLASQLASQGAIKYTSLLLAKCLPGNLDTVQISHVANSADGLQQATNFWKTKNSENALFIWQNVKATSDFMFIWKLAEFENNKLIGDIIEIAVKEKCPGFFNYPNALQLFSDAISVTDSEDTFYRELTECFIAHSQIEKEIIGDSELNIISLSYELHLLVDITKNKKIAEYLTKTLNIINKAQWDKSLQENTWLTTLAISINRKTSRLQLADDLYESLLQYLQSWISNKITPAEDQKGELPKLISMLKDSFRTQLKDRLADHLIDIGFKGNLIAVSSLIEYINIKKIVTGDKGKVQNAVEDSIRKSNIDTLKILDMLLSHRDSEAFRPDKHLAEVFATPLKGLLHNHKDIDKALIERLALKFKVDISANLNDIIILSATYGKGENPKDVTDIVKALINDAKGEQVSFPAENEKLGGDPLPDVVKELKIRYSYLGQEKSITIPEHETVTMP